MKVFMKKVYLGILWKFICLRIVYYRVRGFNLVFVLGVATHSNIGDLAITYAEDRFINESAKNIKTILVGTQLLLGYVNYLVKLIKKNDLIVGHGGGNLGDTYPYEENARRLILEKFPSNRVIIFPQTVYFSGTDTGRKSVEESTRAYADHGELTIIARENKSFDVAKKVFSKNKVMLTPDIVLSLAVESSSYEKRNGVLLCLRNDVEKTLSNDDHSKIIELAGEVSSKVTVTDTMSTDPLLKLRVKKGVVMRKLAEFQHSELVVTDRLHGMVFAAITGTPCIVFSNFNHKIQGTYEWIKDLGYIKYCQSISELSEIDVDKLKANAKHYDPRQFEKYWNIIRDELGVK